MPHGKIISQSNDPVAHRVMRIYVTFIAVQKGDIDVFSGIFPINNHAALELNFQKITTIDVTSQKIRPLPVIAELQAIEAIFGKKSRNFLKIEIFLLTAIELGVANFGKVLHYPSVQSSTTNPGTSAKCFTVLVTTVSPSDKACAAIRRS